MKCFLLAFFIFFGVSCTSEKPHTNKFCDKRDYVAVVLYSNSWCGWCKKTEEFLLDNKIDFLKRNVENPEDRKALLATAKELGFEGDVNMVPIVVVGKQIIVGYDPPSVIAALENERLARWMITNQR